MSSVWRLEFFEVAAPCFEYLCTLVLAHIFLSLMLYLYIDISYMYGITAGITASNIRQ